MNFYFRNRVPVYVHGNWWWQPTGAILRYPLELGGEQPVALQSVANLRRYSEREKIDAVSELMAEWLGQMPASLVVEALPCMLDGLLANVRMVAIINLLHWLPDGHRADYLAMIQQYEEQYGRPLQDYDALFALAQGNEALLEHMEAALGDAEYREHIDRLFALELEKAFPGMMQSCPGVARLDAGNFFGDAHPSAAPDEPFWDAQAMTEFCIASWESMGVDPWAPLTPEALLAAINRTAHDYYKEEPRRSRWLTLAQEAEQLSMAANGIAKDIERRPEAEQEALMRRALPVHVIQEDASWPLYWRAKRMLAEREPGLEKTCLDPDGIVHTDGAAYIPMAATLKDKYNHGIAEGRYLSRREQWVRSVQTGLGLPYSAPYVDERWAGHRHDHVRAEELTHQVQLADFRTVNMPVDGFAGLVLEECLAYRRKQPKQWLGRQPDIDRLLLGHLHKTLGEYQDSYDASIRLGIKSEAECQWLLDCEAFAKFHDIYFLPVDRPRTWQATIASMAPKSAAMLESVLADLRSRMLARPEDASLWYAVRAEDGRRLFKEAIPTPVNVSFDARARLLHMPSIGAGSELVLCRPDDVEAPLMLCTRLEKEKFEGEGKCEASLTLSSHATLQELQQAAEILGQT